jgi:Astacin (Peptidase family M12A)
MHAIGFMHEQNRDDRDRSVRVNYGNIKPGKILYFISKFISNVNKKKILFAKQGTQQNFNKAKAGETTTYGVPYDVASIMHYSKYAFSVNGQPTIEALVSHFLKRFIFFKKTNPLTVHV